MLVDFFFFAQIKKHVIGSCTRVGIEWFLFACKQDGKEYNIWIFISISIVNKIIIFSVYITTKISNLFFAFFQKPLCSLGALDHLVSGTTTKSKVLTLKIETLFLFMCNTFQTGVGVCLRVGSKYCVCRSKTNHILYPLKSELERSDRVVRPKPKSHN